MNSPRRSPWLWILPEPPIELHRHHLRTLQERLVNQRVARRLPRSATIQRFTPSLWGNLEPGQLKLSKLGRIRVIRIMHIWALNIGWYSKTKQNLNLKEKFWSYGVKQMLLQVNYNEPFSNYLSFICGMLSISPRVCNSRVTSIILVALTHTRGHSQMVYESTICFHFIFLFSFYYYYYYYLFFFTHS